jgi:isoleucyl-tRNA synthetase
VSFPLEDEPDVSLIAWTTTPWTLPSNLALCVNAELDYVKVLGLMVQRVISVFKMRRQRKHMSFALREFLNFIKTLLNTKSSGSLSRAKY